MTASAPLKLVHQALLGNDLALIEIVLWFIANCIAESDQMCEFMLKDVQLLERIQSICNLQKANSFSHQTESTLLWILDILTEQNKIVA